VADSAEIPAGRKPIAKGQTPIAAKTSGTLPQDPSSVGAAQAGAQPGRIPVQFVQVPMGAMPMPYGGAAAPYAGMPQQYAMPQGPYGAMPPQFAAGRPTPLAFAPSTAGRPVQANGIEPIGGGGMQGPPIPTAMPSPGAGGGIAPARYDHPNMPGYAWPSYAAYPNYAAVTYPKQYSPSAWPYIGPFYPYPQVPLGWRKVSLEWDDGWWMLDFKDKH
jgi:hypothetical protein